VISTGHRSSESARGPSAGPSTRPGCETLLTWPSSTMWGVVVMRWFYSHGMSLVAP